MRHVYIKRDGFDNKLDAFDVMYHCFVHDYGADGDYDWKNQFEIVHFHRLNIFKMFLP